MALLRAGGNPANRLSRLLNHNRELAERVEERATLDESDVRSRVTVGRTELLQIADDWESRDGRLLFRQRGTAWEILSRPGAPPWPPGAPRVGFSSPREAARAASAMTGTDPRIRALTVAYQPVDRPAHLQELVLVRGPILYLPGFLPDGEWMWMLDITICKRNSRRPVGGFFIPSPAELPAMRITAELTTCGRGAARSPITTLEAIRRLFRAEEDRRRFPTRRAAVEAYEAACSAHAR